MSVNVKVFEKAAKALPADFFASPPLCGLILGSGWGDALSSERPIAEISYSDIPGMGASTVVGHAGKMALLMRYGVRIVACFGRRHWYEGAGWEPVILPVELMRRMGVKNLLVTNAAGGINSRLKPGAFMVLRDHINTVGNNPLVGPVVPGWGPRFPDQSEVYDESLIALLRQAACDVGTTLTEGVYAFTSGPVFETPAEIRAYAGMGADAVGMSTVPETTLASACGIRTAGLSCITNMAAGISGPHLCHEEVLAETEKATPVMSALVDAFLLRLASGYLMAAQGKGKVKRVKGKGK